MLGVFKDLLVSNGVQQTKRINAGGVSPISMNNFPKDSSVKLWMMSTIEQSVQQKA